VNKRIEDIHLKREQQEVQEEEGLEALVKEIEDKSKFTLFSSYLLVNKNEENTKQLL
jgi:hypothetical protein